jgi:hypothetical protein
MRDPVIIAVKILIPMFAKEPRHPAVPLGHRTAGVRSEAQGWPPAGACALPLTAASTLASWRLGGGRAVTRYAAVLLIGVLSLGSEAGIAVAQSASAVRPAAVDLHAAHIAEASQRFGIPEHWIAAVLRAESAGDVRAISSAGAMGLMQIMPDTWAELSNRYGLGRDPFDARNNIHAGAAYLREMWDRYGNVAAMLAAYNAGPGRYDEYLANGRVLPGETRAYVAALVPILGGAAATEPHVPAPPRPLDWREAPLFVTRSDGALAVAAPLPDAHSGGDSADAEPETGGIFVARASAGASPW